MAAVALVYFARRWWLARRQRVAEREAAHAAIGARADKQHTWVLASDDRAPGSIRTYDAGFNSRPISAIAVRSRLLLQENDIRILTRVVISHGFAFVLAHKYE